MTNGGDEQRSGAGAARVAVVGGGLAGLAAAERLIRAGVAVTVFEREAAPGGRRRGVWREGRWLPRHAGAHETTDRILVGWLSRLDRSSELLPLRPVQRTHWHAGGRHPLGDLGPRSAWGHPGIRRLEALRLVRLGRLLARYGPELEAFHPERAARWDDRSVADFARLYFGPTVFERLLGPFAASLTTGDAGETSRALVLRQAALSQGAVAGLLRAPLDDVFDALGRALRLRAETRVERVEPAGQGLRVVAPGTEVEAPFDAVVVAVAAHEALRILGGVATPAERDHLAGVRYHPSLCLALSLEQPTAGGFEELRIPHAEGLALQSLLTEPGTAGGRAPESGALVTATATARFARAHAEASDEVVAKALLQDVERVRPGVEIRVAASHLSRRAEGVPQFQVGAYRALARFRRAEADLRAQGRRLYYAGSHLFGPRDEDVVASGLRAAESLLRDAEATNRRS
ncbi:MAG: FAD-dependent oxidoreductase [Proteobacteria bacterium]|nr:FAD-dependent oxidoreductase [Pseudomonadota bacterium]